MSKVKEPVKFSEADGTFTGYGSIVFLLILAVTIVGGYVASSYFSRHEVKDNVFDKENCIGQFNTVVCHQKKINELLKARDMENLNK